MEVYFRKGQGYCLLGGGATSWTDDTRSDSQARVKPSERVRACSDPDDDIFLECLQDARAHSLVTGKIKHCPLN
jgi:hypothetical protein